MNRIIKKGVVLLISVIFLIGVLPYSILKTQGSSLVLAEENYLSAITVTERNGVSVCGYHVRRSIPFAEGILSADTEFVITDDTDIIPSDAEVLSVYEDGSVRWLLVSFTVNMEAYEEKTLYLKEGTYETNLFYDSSSGILENGIVTMSITDSGINNLSGSLGFAAEHIGLYVSEGNNTYSLHNGEITILAMTNSYIKVRIAGILTNGIDGVIEITLPAESEKLQLDYRINVKRNVRIASTGLSIVADHDQDIGDRILDNVLSFTGMEILSYDNHRFNGAVQNAETGFLIEDNGVVKLAPLVNFTHKDNGYTFFDGAARTCHAYFCTDGDETQIANVINPLQVNISPTVYKNAGILYDDKMTVPAQEMIETILSIKGKLNGRFEAGSIPLGLTEQLDVSNDNFNSKPGETEYNLGYGYMMSGEEDIYTLIMDSAEAWADCTIYKGQYEQIYGACRSVSGNSAYKNDSHAFASHPYYGDPSGLYMAYILSGNEYLKEIFLACCDHLVNSMYLTDNTGKKIADNFGNYMPYKWFWQEDGSNQISRAVFSESRYMICARPLYLAYQLTGDDIYYEASMDICKWATDKQQPDGSWPQAYYHYKVEKVLDEYGCETYDENGKVKYRTIYYNADETYEDKFGSIMIHSNQAVENDKFDGFKPFKIYIMLYGYRGVSDIMHWEKNEAMEETLLRFADYLCYQNESFGPGLRNPNGDEAVYPENEDGSSGKNGTTDLMASEVLAKAYEICGDDKYLKNICSLLQQYLCSALGCGSVAVPELGKNAVSFTIGIGRSSTYLKSASYISWIMKNNQEKISRFGYDNLLTAFHVNAVRTEIAEGVEYDSPFVTHNIYSANGEKVLFAAANTPINLKNNGVLRLEMSENKLWQGEKIENYVDESGNVILQKEVQQYDTLVATQRPIHVVSKVGSYLTITIVEYNQQQVKLNVVGLGSSKIFIDDGLFPVMQNTSYHITQTANHDDSITITVSEGTGVTTVGDSIVIDVYFEGNYHYDNFNRDSGFGQYTFSHEMKVANFPDIKDKSLKLTKGQTMSRCISNASNISVISQDFYMNTSAERHLLMSFGEQSIFVAGNELFLNDKTTPFSVVEENTWFKLTIVTDKNNRVFKVYVNGLECVNDTIADEITLLTYSIGSNALYIDNLVLGYYNTIVDAENFLVNSLHRELNEFERLLIKRIEALEKTTGESLAFYSKLTTIKNLMQNTMVSVSTKEKYIEMLEELESCAENSERWLILAENFECETVTGIHSGDIFSETNVLASTQATITGNEGVLRLQRQKGITSPRITLRSWETGDDLLIRFKYMQQWRNKNPYLYYCADNEQKDYAIRIGSLEDRFYYYNGNSSELLLRNYKAGHWYEFAVYVHYNERTYDIYVDGELKAENIAFSSLQNDFDRPEILRMFNVSIGSDRGSYYYDDIYIYGVAPEQDRVSIVKQNDDTGDYFSVRVNVIYENLTNSSKPWLLLGVYNEKGTMVKAITSPSTERNMLISRLYTHQLKDGKYTIKSFLFDNKEFIRPISISKERKFTVSGGRILN